MDRENVAGGPPKQWDLGQIDSVMLSGDQDNDIFFSGIIMGVF